MQQRVTLYLKLNIFFEDGLKGSSDEAPVAAVRLKNLQSYETRSNNCQFFYIIFFPFFSFCVIQIVQRYEPGVKEIAQPIKILSGAEMCFADEDFS